MSEAKGSLSSLLKYRFVRKPSSKLSHSDSISSGLQRDDSTASVDSQATLPYTSNGSQDISDTQATQPYQQQDQISDAASQSHLSPPKQESPSFRKDNSIGNAKANSEAPSSPIFTSKIAGKESFSATISTPTATPSPGPWISKKIGVTDGLNGESASSFEFKRVQRPQMDSDEESPVTQNGHSFNYFERLKEMFPDKTENLVRAALIVHPNNFDAAVEYLVGSKVPAKRPAPIESPESKPSYKRIKPMPETPSPTGPIIMSVDYLKECEAKKKEKQELQKGVLFLKECFPALSSDNIRQVLKAHDGDTDKASEALSKTQDDELKRISDTSSTNQEAKTGKQSLLKTKMAVNKAKKKKNWDDDMSDDEDEFGDEYDDSGDSDDSEEFDNRTKTETDNFLQLFEEATIEELSAMPGCSKKKAELIVSLRPFKTWDNLLGVFTSQKQLSTSLISGCKEIMQVRNAVRRLMVRCESISQQMEQVVARLTSGAGSADQRITKQPELLNKEFKLQPYQLIGLSWLRIMHEQELNGILADEMGLGKTIQAIAFVAHLLEEGEQGPHVIIVPSSTIENWLRELQSWCSTLKVIVYYGSQDERRAVRHSILRQGEQFNILLTTYNMATGSVEDRVLFKKFDFHYAVFDEGHMLKNMSSMRFQNLMKISAERRLLLTGTPLQNNLLELMSLLCFVMPEIFQGKTDHLKKVFAMISRSDDKQKSRFEKDRIEQAKRIMKPFVLRRLKKDVLQQLPKKTESIHKCSMSSSQQDLYDSLVTKYSTEINEAGCVSDGGDANTTAAGVGIFMQFRKAANHPLLLRRLFKDAKLRKMAKAIAKEPSHRDRGALPELIQEDMSVMNDFELMGLCKQYPKYLGKFNLDQSVILDSGKFNKLDEMLPDMKERGDRVLLFSQFTMLLDVVELYLEMRGHKFIRLDGQTPVPDRLQLIDRFNNEADIFVFLLSTRAGGVGINLCAANTIILHDIDFNPYNDKQAEDRCHRLGQKREVKVHKLICESTVDEAMLECARGKLALEQDLTGTEDAEGGEENMKDVAKLLKEVLRLRQKGMGSSSTGAATNGFNKQKDDSDEEDDEDDLS